MQHVCRLCGSTWSPLPGEEEFYGNVSPVFGGRKCVIPFPTLCPLCRRRRRFAHRNERFLHQGTCDLTGEALFTFYRKDSPVKVYEHKAWWSDRWDALSYGGAFGTSRGFLRQFQDLRIAVPRQNMTIVQTENCDYAPYCVHTRNCYMTISSADSDNCHYCYQANSSRDCLDCTYCVACELCSECTDCMQCIRSSECSDCENCSECFSCSDCRGCSMCIGCMNIIGKRYCILNEQKSEREYREMMAVLDSFTQRHVVAHESRERWKALPTRASHIVQSENCTGDHLRNCRNSFECFDSSNLEDCAYAFPFPPAGAKNVRDTHYAPGAELCYDCMSVVRSFRTCFALHSWDDADCYYIDECFSCRNCFGCVGLRHKEYCILNKQYLKEEYEELVPKIIGHMQMEASGLGTWGEFLPEGLSLFPYNESVAQEICPLAAEVVRARGWIWKESDEEIPSVARTIPASMLPDTIRNVPGSSSEALAKEDDILNWAIKCEATGRPFRIVKPELAFYRAMNLPIPRFHPDERHRRRMARRNPRGLWKRTCGKCGREMETTYSPERPEKVYCESCYLKEVY